VSLCQRVSIRKACSGAMAGSACVARERAAAMKAIIGVVAVLVLAGVLFGMLAGGPNETVTKMGQAYYVDVNGGAIFTAVKDAATPLAPPNSTEKTGYGAQIFSCGACVESEMFIGYIEMVSESGAAAIKAIEERGERAVAVDNPEMMIDLQNAQQVSLFSKGGAPDSVNWVSMSSQEGEEVIRSVLDVCSNGGIKPCTPLSK